MEADSCAKVPEGPTSSGMVISLPGVLLRAATACERSGDAEYLAPALRQLLEHLRLVRADPARIAEFLALWVDDAPRTALPPEVGPDAP